jgi:hypothetical protein
MMHWIFLMLTAQFFLLLAVVRLLFDLKGSLREIDSHLVGLRTDVDNRLAQLTGRDTATGGTQP